MTTKSSCSTGARSKSKLAFLTHVKYEHLLAGISGGVTSTLILHPLDLIKIRFAGKNILYKTALCNKTTNTEFLL